MRVCGLNAPGLIWLEMHVVNRVPYIYAKFLSGTYRAVIDFAQEMEQRGFPGVLLASHAAAVPYDDGTELTPSGTARGFADRNLGPGLRRG